MKRLFTLALAFAPATFASMAHAQSTNYTFTCTDSAGNTDLAIPMTGFFYQNTNSTINFSVTTTLDQYVNVQNAYYQTANNFSCQISPAEPVGISIFYASIADIDLAVSGGSSTVTATFTATYWSYSDAKGQTAAKMKPATPEEKSQALARFLARLPKAPSPSATAAATTGK